MEIDPLESTSNVRDSSRGDARARQLNSWVAVTIALLATFAGICKVRDDNLVQAMQQAQADKLDHWNFYQARNIRQDVAEAALDQLELTTAGASAEGRKRAAPVIARYRATAERQKTQKAELKKAAEADQKLYDELNYRDDQFDLADALTAIAISLLALTSLTQKRWLFGVALVATLLGLIMGLAGLLSWRLHPDAISRLLS